MTRKPNKIKVVANTNKKAPKCKHVSYKCEKSTQFASCHLHAMTGGNLKVSNCDPTSST